MPDAAAPSAAAASQGPAPDPDVTPEQTRQVAELEARAILAAESKDLAQSAQLLQQAVALAPRYASAHNNLAQVYQLQGLREKALEEADTAVRIAESKGDSDRLVLRQSLTQRALLRRALNLSPDAVLADFERAAKLGSALARREAVRANPYAALCNQYLAAALERHWSGLDATDASPHVAPAAAGGSGAADAAAAGVAQPQRPAAHNAAGAAAAASVPASSGLAVNGAPH